MRFSVKRLLWAFAVWSGAFALLHSEWTAPNVAAVIVATSLAAVVLLWRVDHVVPVMAVVLGALAGVVVVWLIPAPSGGSGELIPLETAFFGALGGSFAMRALLGLLSISTQPTFPQKIEGNDDEK